MGWRNWVNGSIKVTAFVVKASVVVVKTTFKAGVAVVKGIIAAPAFIRNLVAIINAQIPELRNRVNNIRDMGLLTGQVINAFFAIAIVKKKTNLFIDQSIEAISTIINKRTVQAIRDSERSQLILKQIAKITMFFLVTQILIHKMLDTGFSFFQDEHKSEPPRMKNYALYLMFTVQISILIQRTIRMMMNNASLAKDVADDEAKKRPPSDPKNNDEYKACGHDVGALVTTMLTRSSFYTVFKVVNLAASYVPILKCVTYVSDPLLTGYGLAENQLSTMCGKDRDEILISNSYYCFTLGGVCLALEYGLTKFIQDSVGVQLGFFGRYILSDCIYQYAVVAVNARREKMPGIEPGFDVFSIPREKLMTRINGAVRYLTGQKKPASDAAKQDNPSQNIAWIKGLLQQVDWLKWLRRLHEQKWIQSVERIMLWDVVDDWGTGEAFKQSSAVRHFFRAYYPDIKWYLDYAQEMRKDPSERNFVSLSEYARALIAPRIPNMPNVVSKWLVSRDYKLIISVLFKDSLEKPLEKTIEYFDGVKALHDKLDKDEATTKKPFYVLAQTLFERLLPPQPVPKAVPKPPEKTGVAMNPGVDVFGEYEEQPPPASPHPPAVQPASVAQPSQRTTAAQVAASSPAQREEAGPEVPRVNFKVFADLSELEERKKLEAEKEKAKEKEKEDKKEEDNERSTIPVAVPLVVPNLMLLRRPTGTSSHPPNAQIGGKTSYLPP